MPASAPIAFLRKDRIIAPPDFNRWKMPLVSVAMHLCMGSVYSWSIFNPALVKELGIVASSADDWGTNSVVWIFSVAIVFVGMTAAIAGRTLDELGPRFVGVLAAILWGGGFIVGGVGIYLHELWVVYLGYGFLGGCGLGVGYVSPVATLIRWFPNRRGMATGMAIMGFGGGAIIGAPVKEYLLRFFYESPQYLGGVDAVALVTEGGRRFAEVAGRSVEVVVVGAADVSNMIVPEPAGVYVAGTGGTGAAETFFTLGVVYFIIMIIAAFAFRLPAEGWRPKGSVVGQGEGSLLRRRIPPGPDVHVDEAPKTQQFYLLWVVLCLNIAAGIGIIGIAKTMMTDIFGSSLPSIATPGFAATYVLMISVFNMLGRFGWAYASDYMGRKKTYYTFFVLGALLYLSIPFVAMQVSADPVVLWLILFYAITMIIFTMYGGGFATIAAYVSDLFGSMHVGAIHGRLLSAWAVAGILGPFVITFLRDLSLRRSINDLAAKVDPAAFQAKFGAPMSSLQELIDAKTVTIIQLLEIAPAGTADPTPSAYNEAMFVMAGLLVIAFVANRLIHPVAEKHHFVNTHGGQR